MSKQNTKTSCSSSIQALPEKTVSVNREAFLIITRPGRATDSALND